MGEIWKTWKIRSKRRIHKNDILKTCYFLNFTDVLCNGSYAILLFAVQLTVSHYVSLINSTKTRIETEILSSTLLYFRKYFFIVNLITKFVHDIETTSEDGGLDSHTIPVRPFLYPEHVDSWICLTADAFSSSPNLQYFQFCEINLFITKKLCFLCKGFLLSLFQLIGSHHVALITSTKTRPETEILSSILLYFHKHNSVIYLIVKFVHAISTLNQISVFCSFIQIYWYANLEVNFGK